MARSIVFILALVLGLRLAAQPLPFDATKAAGYAREDLAAGRVMMLTYGHPEDPQSRRLTDSVTALFGFKYRSIAGCIVDESITEYAKNYNEVVEAHLQAKLGKNWRSEYELIRDRVYLEAMIRDNTAEQIAENYILVTGNLYFEQGETRLSAAHRKFLKANALGFKEALKFEEEIGEEVVFTITPYALEGEGKELGEKRAELVYKELLRLGVPKKRLILGEVQKNPYSRDGFGYFVAVTSN